MCVPIDNLSPENAYVNLPTQRIDANNPFCNPTQEADYSPDYGEIVPQIHIPGCRLPYTPSSREKKSIRKYYNLAGLLAFLDFALAAFLASAITLGATIVLQLVDSLALHGQLPENYSNIAQQYLSDSSVLMAANLLGFLISNVTVFFLGCKLSRMKPMSFFKDRDLRLSSTLRYCVLGLLIQFSAGYLVDYIGSLLKEDNPLFSAPDMSTGSSPTKLMITVLYACLIAPITEELVFRGVFLKNMSRVSQRFGIFTSALFFALAHQNIPQGVLAFLLGILLGYITIKHNSLVPAMIVHFVVNVTSTVFTQLDQIAPLSADRLFTLVSIIIFILGIIMLLYTLATERLPDDTPFQRIRCTPVAVCSWGLWLATLLHIGMMLATTLASMLQSA
ncbi:MAG: lysostaphin resistance A-like protein [Oscillospiraceae bacterium]